MSTANQALARAAQEVGYYRYDDPQAGTIYGRWYAQKMGSPSFGASGVPFCAMFASYILDQVGQSCPGLPAAYCPYILRDCRNAGIVLADKKQARPGDLVLFDWDGGVVDHIGFVELNRGTSLQTIEGNTNGGRVARRSRAWSSVRAVVRVPYDGAAKPSATGPNLGSDLTVWGPLFTREMQTQLGTPVDGIISCQYAGNKPYFWATEGCVDWSKTYVGSTMVCSLQKKVGASVDGHMGPETIKAHQRWLIKHGYSVGASGADGYNGHGTNRAVAAALTAGAYR